MFCEATRIIDTPPQAIWDLIADLSRLREWLPVDLEYTLPQGAQAAVGVTIQVRRKTRMGLIEIDQVIGHCEAPQVLAWRHSREMLNGNPITQIKDFSTTISLAENGANQTRVTVRSTWNSVGPTGIMASTMLKPQLQREYNAALENIAALTKHQPGARA